MPEDKLKKMIKWLSGGPKSEAVITSSVSLYRSISGLPFVSADDSGTDADSIIGKILSLPDEMLKKPFEKLVCSKSPDYASFLSSCGILPDDYLKRSECVFDIKKGRSILFGASEHLCISCVKPGLSLACALKDAVKLDTKINSVFEYAYSDKFGHSLSSMNRSGSGTFAKIILHLPVLSMIKAVPEIKKRLGKTGIVFEPFIHDSPANPGSLYRLSNRYSFGSSEDEIASKIGEIALTLAKMENETREEYYSENKEQLEDRILKSFGLLNYAKMLSYHEAMEHLSNVRIGIIMALFQSCRMAEFNNVFFSVGRDIITHNKGKSGMTLPDEAVIRASYVRDVLKN